MSKAMKPAVYCAKHDTYSYPECLRCVIDERDELRDRLADTNRAYRLLVADADCRGAIIGRLQAWTHEHGAQLCPRGADTYGNGVRDSKEAVAKIIAFGLRAVPQ